jgi:hypothetical protein
MIQSNCKFPSKTSFDLIKRQNDVHAPPLGHKESAVENRGSSLSSLPQNTTHHIATNLDTSSIAPVSQPAEAKEAGNTILTSTKSTADRKIVLGLSWSSKAKEDIECPVCPSNYSVKGHRDRHIQIKRMQHCPKLSIL